MPLIDGTPGIDKRAWTVVCVVILGGWLLSSGACTGRAPSYLTEPDPAQALSTVPHAPDTRPASVQKPPPGAFLHLETGMHTALISRVGVDKTKRILVTGSH